MMMFVSRATTFALGLASTLAALGFVSTYAGKAYGSIGSGLPIGALVTKQASLCESHCPCTRSDCIKYCSLPDFILSLPVQRSASWQFSWG